MERLRCSKGAPDTTAVGRAAYRAELELVATPRELSEWDSVPSAQRSDWLASFWSKRDVAEGRKAGARLIEHYRRYRFALQFYSVALPQIGRQQSLTVSETVDLSVEDAAKKWALRHPNCAPDLARMLTDSRLLGADSANTRYYKPIQDRVTTIEASCISGTVSQQPLPRPLAASHLRSGVTSALEGPLVLQFRETDFDGSSGASVLVPSLLTLSPVMTNEVCDAEQSLCSLSGRFQPIDRAPKIVIADPPTPLCRVADRENGGVGGFARLLDIEVHREGTRLSSEAIVRARDAGRRRADRSRDLD